MTDETFRVSTFFIQNEIVVPFLWQIQAKFGKIWTEPGDSNIPDYTPYLISGSARTIAAVDLIYTQLIMGKAVVTTR